jgi:ankyrin repeat protein
MDIPLIYSSILSGDLSSVISSCANNNNNILIDYENKTPFHLIGFSGHTHLLEFFMKNSKIIQRYSKDNRGRNILHYSCQFNHFDVLSELYRYPDFSQLANDCVLNFDNDGFPPIALAVQYNNLDTLKWLHRHGSNLNIKFGIFQTTLIHLAIVTTSYECLLYLLTECDNDCIRKKNNLGDTPLHLASMLSKNKDIIQALVRNSNEITTLDRDVNGNLPIHLACLHSNLIAIDILLLDKNATNFINLKNHSHHTPFLYAIHSGDFNTIRHLFGSSNILINNNINMESVDYYGRDAVSICAGLGFADLLEYLLDIKRLTVSKQDLQSGMNALHWVCNNNNSNNNEFESCAKILLDRFHKSHHHHHHHQKNSNTKIIAASQPDNYGYTPLHFAVLRCHIEIIILLLNHSVDIHSADMDGNTPLHIAYGIQNMKIIELLLPRANCNIKNKNGIKPNDMMKKKYIPSFQNQHPGLQKENYLIRHKLLLTTTTTITTSITTSPTTTTSPKTKITKSLLVHDALLLQKKFNFEKEQKNDPEARLQKLITDLNIEDYH